MIKTAKTHGVGVGTVQRLARESRQCDVTKPVMSQR